MRTYARMHRYPIESQIEQKNGYVKVKVAEHKWQGLGAYLLTKAGVKIVDGDRVFFADGDRANRSVENLRRIHFNTVKFVLLPHSRPIYIPKVEPKPEAKAIPFVIKKPIERRIYQVA